MFHRQRRTLIFRVLPFVLTFFLCQEATALDSFLNERILKYIEDNLPLKGILRKTSENFVYVDIDDAYIHKLISFIQEDGFEEPPYFFKPKSAGAHISVIYEEEMKQSDLLDIEECGETVTFKPKEYLIVHPPNWAEMEEFFVLLVEAPSLDQLRKKYHLPEKKYEFHITVGVKRKASSMPVNEH